MLEDFRTGFHRGAAESGDIARGIQSRANFIDHAAVINARPDFGVQFIFLHHAQPMIELARDHLRLAGVVVEMLLLAGHFQVAATREVAIDIFFADNLLHTIDGFEGCSVHALGAFAAIHRNELVHAQLHSSQNHAAIAGTGSPAESFGFQNSDFCAALRQGASRGEAGVAGANHSNIHMVRQGTGFQLGKLGCREPVVAFLQGHGLL